MQAEQLKLGTCLAKKDFQDWLSSVGILKRAPISGSPILLPAKICRPSKIITTFIQLLENNWGYVVDSDTVVKTVYGETDNRRRNNMAGISNYLEARLNPAVSFYKSRWVGFGLGVESFLLNFSSIPVVYRLWEDLGYYVPLSELATARYGVNDPTTRINVVKNVTDHLRLGRLQNTSLELDYLGSHYRKSIAAGTLSFRMFEKPHGPVKQSRDRL